MPAATVTATARGIVPRPEAMGPCGRLLKVTWMEGSVRCHCAGPGFWWMAAGPAFNHIKTIAGFEAGTEVTLEWEPR